MGLRLRLRLLLLRMRMQPLVDIEQPDCGIKSRRETKRSRNLVCFIVRCSGWKNLDRNL